MTDSTYVCTYLPACLRSVRATYVRTYNVPSLCPMHAHGPFCAHGPRCHGGHSRLLCELHAFSANWHCAEVRDVRLAGSLGDLNEAQKAAHHPGQAQAAVSHHTGQPQAAGSHNPVQPQFLPQGGFQSFHGAFQQAPQSLFCAGRTSAEPSPGWPPPWAFSSAFSCAGELSSNFSRRSFALSAWGSPTSAGCCGCDVLDPDKPGGGERDGRGTGDPPCSDCVHPCAPLGSCPRASLQAVSQC